MKMFFSKTGSTIFWTLKMTNGLHAGIEKASGYLVALNTQRLLHREVIGPDISFYQDDDTTPRKVDFIKMGDQGADFVVLRAGQRTWADPDYKDYRKAVEGILPWGAYWFFDSRSEPIAQADLFWSIVGEIPPLALIADYEERYQGPYAGWVNFKKFLLRIQSLSNIPIEHLWIYSAYYYWIEHSPQDQPAELDFFGRYPYWHAQYTSSLDLLIPKPWAGKMDEPIAHQFTDAGDGRAYGVESLDIDLSYLNMTREQFFEYTNFKPQGEPNMVYGKTAVNLRARSGPSASYSTILTMPAGTIVSAEIIQNGWWKLLTINGDSTTQELWSYQGLNNGYITVIDPPVTQAPSVIEILLAEGSQVIIRDAQGNQLWP